MLLLYNPRVAKPGYQRLPLSLLQLGSLLEGEFEYSIADANVAYGADPAGQLVDRLSRGDVRYLGVTIMPGPQLQRAVPELRKVSAVDVTPTKSE